MAYTYCFYRFPSHSAFAAAWAEAGLPLAEGQPVMAGGALDEIGAVSTPGATAEDPPVAVDGWHVNVAWPGDAPGALAAAEIAPFDGLRVYAGWSDAGPPPPVPEQVTNFQARTALRHAGMFEAADAALNAMAADMDAAGDAIGAATIREAWAKASFMRASGLVAAVGVQLNVTPAQMDELFRAAALIEV